MCWGSHHLLKERYTGTSCELFLVYLKVLRPNYQCLLWQQQQSLFAYQQWGNTLTRNQIAQMILQWKCFNSICGSSQEPSISLSLWKEAFLFPIYCGWLFVSPHIYLPAGNSVVLSLVRSPLVSKQQSFFLKHFLDFHFLLWSTFSIRGCW